MGQVYALKGRASGRIKIGVADSVERRLAAYRTHCGEDLEVLAAVEVGGNYERAVAVERQALIEARRVARVAHGDWFEPCDGLTRVIDGLAGAWPPVKVEASEGLPRYEHRCKRCGGNWTTVLAEPKNCGRCSSSLWNVEKIRRVGGGRPKGSGRVPPEKIAGKTPEVEELW